MVTKGLLLALFVVAVSRAGGMPRISMTQQDLEVAADVAAGGTQADRQQFGIVTNAPFTPAPRIGYKVSVISGEAADAHL